MGTADVIPGVSGGTMAFILNIYKELLAAIKSFDLVWIISIIKLDFKSIVSKPHFYFLIPLGVGIFCALIFFTRVISLPNLLHSNPEEVYGLFFGLIAGSIVILMQQLGSPKIREVMPLVFGISLGLYVFHFVPIDTPDTAWFTFLSGAIAICAMILPGISGSFILLILNKYVFIFNAIGYFKLSILFPFALGVVTGLVFFSRFLHYLLQNYYRPTVMFITGLLLASLTVIWPFQDRIYATVRGKARLIESNPLLPAEFSQTVIFSILFTIAGLLVVLIMNKFASIKSGTAD